MINTSCRIKFISPKKWVKMSKILTLYFLAKFFYSLNHNSLSYFGKLVLSSDINVSKIRLDTLYYRYFHLKCTLSICSTWVANSQIWLPMIIWHFNGPGRPIWANLHDSEYHTVTGENI